MGELGSRGCAAQGKHSALGYKTTQFCGCLSGKGRLSQPGCCWELPSPSCWGEITALMETCLQTVCRSCPLCSLVLPPHYSSADIFPTEDTLPAFSMGFFPPPTCHLTHTVIELCPPPPSSCIPHSHKQDEEQLHGQPFPQKKSIYSKERRSGEYPADWYFHFSASGGIQKSRAHQ